MRYKGYEMIIVGPLHPQQTVRQLLSMLLVQPESCIPSPGTVALGTLTIVAVTIPEMDSEVRQEYTCFLVLIQGKETN